MVLKIISWNAHSLQNKFTELFLLIDKLSIDIILISESWLTDNSTFYIPGFSSYRADRFRGGAAIFIRSSIPHFGFVKSQFDYAESCTVSICLGNTVVKISSIYCSPSATRSQSKLFFNHVLNQPGPLVVSGDFNAKHIDWNNTSNDRKGSDLAKILNHLNFKIFKPNEPTLYPYNGDPSCVDFVVAKSYDSVSSIEVLNDLSSDHLPLLFNINLQSVQSFSHSQLNLSKVNWTKFRHLINMECNSIVTDFSSPESISASVDNISTMISNALSCSAPKKKPFLLRYKYSQAVNVLIKNRNHFRNLYKRSRDPAFKSSMNLLNRMIRHQIRTEKSIAFAETLKELSYHDNSLFKFAKSLKRKARSIPPLTDNVGKHYSDKDKADACARNFENSFSIVQNSISKYDNLVKSSVQALNSNSVLPQFSDFIHRDEVMSIFKFLNPKKSCGQDNIPNSALSSLSSCTSFISLCTDLFNACFKMSYFPNQWKIAKIIPIPKSKDNCTSPDNFRPISLLSCLGKCFEKLILNRLNDFEMENEIFIKQQCGFRSQHSTVHQILRITEEISFGFNKNKSTGIVLLDLRKAFDSVWHDGLIHKLIVSKYPQHLIKLIQSYLKGRSAYVFFQSVDSYTFSVSSGVPQGSIIAPHLFNLFINDIFIPRKGHLSLFADDTAFFVQSSWKNLKTIKSDLVKTFNSLQNYFKDWKINLNEAKTEFSVFTKSTKMIEKLSDDVITVNNKTFSWSESIKYLGVILDRKLTFKHHINYSINKASAACFSSLYCILNRNSHVSIDSKLRIYKSYIRPILTYGCPVFSNAALCHSNKLQLFQNKILRMIHNIHWNDFKSTDEIHDLSKVPLICNFISKLTDKFYSKIPLHPNDLFSSLGQYNSETLRFRAKHKLPRALV
jgi:hypothetical protein